MKRVAFMLLAAGAVACWVGCTGTEPATPVAQQPSVEIAPPSTDDPAADSSAEVIQVSLSVPNMT